MSHRRVLRYEVPIDDEPHEIGGGKVIHVNYRPRLFTGLPARVEVWTEEELPDDWPVSAAVRLPRMVQVFRTGSPLPGDAFRHLGSANDLDQLSGSMWHLYEVSSGGR